MKTIAFLILQMIACKVGAGTPVRPTPEEEAIGVRNAEQIGAWKVRTGWLAVTAAQTFGAEQGGCKFAYATQTVNEKWTLGVRLVDEVRTVRPAKDPASGYINERDKVGVEQIKASPVVYLQGPNAVTGFEKIQVWSGKSWREEEVRAQKDGTVRWRTVIPESGKLFIKWRGQNLTFDMTDSAKALALVMAVQAPPPPPAPAPPPVPQPPPR